MTYLLAPAFLPFSIAAAVLLGLVLLEAIGVLIGATPSALFDASALGHAFETMFGWLNLGRVPGLILIILLLAVFSIAGMAIQSTAMRFGPPLPTWVAAAVASIAALVVTRRLSAGVARLLPRDETYAVSDDDLIGRVGIVTLGPLDGASPGRASVTDGHGNRHFPRVRLANPGDLIAVGEPVLLIEKFGREFNVIRAPASLDAGRPS